MIETIINRILYLEEQGLTAPYIYARLAVEGYTFKDVDEAFRQLEE